MSDNSKRYWARPRVGVMARSCCISQKNQAGFEQMLKFLMNLLIFLMVNTFSWKGNSMITLPPNEQNSSLVCTYLILVALSRPLYVQNFMPTPLTSGNHLHKCHKKCSPEYFSCPPYTYAINYLDFHQVNYMQDLGSLFLFSSLESIDFVGCYATQL